MTLKAAGPETRLQSASRRLAESQALLARHDAELVLLRQTGLCVREALAVHDELREQVAQSQRDVIWAQDRIRFGLDAASFVLSAPNETSGIDGDGKARAADRAPATIANRKENASSKNRPGREAA